MLIRKHTNELSRNVEHMSTADVLQVLQRSAAVLSLCGVSLGTGGLPQVVAPSPHCSPKCCCVEPCCVSCIFLDDEAAPPPSSASFLNIVLGTNKKENDDVLDFQWQ
jgi:hypothetical protein